MSRAGGWEGRASSSKQRRGLLFILTLTFPMQSRRSLARIARLRTDRSTGRPGRRLHCHTLARRPSGPGFHSHRCAEQPRCEVHYASQRDRARRELGSHTYPDCAVAMGQDGAGCRCDRRGHAGAARSEYPWMGSSRRDGGSAQRRWSRSIIAATQNTTSACAGSRRATLTLLCSVSTGSRETWTPMKLP